MESIHNYLVDMEINGKEITPTLNKLVDEGMYFSNFYPQISIGTSSDTEFTLNTSLMPANIGTAFVQYSDVTYESIPNILSEKGYYTSLTESAKKKMSLASQIKYSGLKSLEDDIYEYRMRIKNVETENDAIYIIRQIILSFFIRWCDYGFKKVFWSERV